MTGGTVLAAVVLLGAALWPVLSPLTQRTPLTPQARWTDVGVPVPAAAARCGTGRSSTNQFLPRSGAGPTTDTTTNATTDTTIASTRWCLPGRVGAETLAAWYRRALPAGSDAGALRWCVEQVLGNGARRALWATDTGLVGYVLPPAPSHPRAGSVGRTVVEVVQLPAATCPAASPGGRHA